MKALKLLVVLVVVLVLVVVGGIAAFISFADPNDFKDRIAAEVLEETGRTLTLDGDLEWAFWPKLRLKAGPLALSNAPGFGDAAFVAAEEIQLAVATLPLLQRQIKMDTVKVYGLRVNLAANADGVTNWADLVGEPGDDKGAGDMAAIALGGVDVRDAEISWRDAATGQNVDVRKLNVGTGALTFGDPIAIDLSFSAQANKPALDSDVALVGTVAYDLGDEHYQIAPLNLDIVMRGKHLPGGEATVTSSAAIDIDLDAGSATIGELSINGLGSSLNGTITATDIESASPGARGTLQLSGEDLAAVFAALELPVAKQIARLDKRGFELATEFDANMASGEVNVPKLSGNMLGATLDAMLEAQRADTDKPAAKGRIDAAGPDLPALLAVFGQLQGMEAKTLDNLVTVLRGTKDKSFSVQTNFDADMRSGVINVPQLEAKLLGNTISGNVASASAGGDKSALNGSVTASGPDLPSLLAIAATFQGPQSGLHDMSKSLAGAPNKAFSLDSKFSTDGGSGKIDLPQLSATGLGLTIDGRMRGQNLDDDNGTLDGQLSVTGDNVAPLLTALGHKDLAQSVRAIDVAAGIKGTMSDMTFSPLKLVANIKGPGQPKPVPVTLTADSARANLAKETLSVRDLTLKGLGMNISGAVEATKIKGDAEFTGNLNVPNFNLRNVLTNLNTKLPPMQNRQALSSFGLNTAFSGSKKRLALEDLTMKLDTSTLKGDITINDFTGPDIAFGLGIDQINADNYMAPAAKGSAPPVTPESAAAGAAQLPVKALRALKLKGDLLIGSLQISGAKMQNAKLSITANGGKIVARPIAAALYGGKYNGAMVINAKGQAPAVNINTNLSGVNIEPLLFDMTGDRSLSGVANLDAKLKLRGRKTTAMKRSLNGPLKFSVNNGIYRGIDVARMLQQIELMIESKRPGTLSKGGETRFQSLSGTIKFANGVGSNNDLLLDGSGFRITGKGIVANLHNDTMKYDAEVSVDKGSAQRGESNYNLGGYSVPIRCRGKLGADACKPDAGNIIAEIGKNAVQKEVGKQIEKAIGGDAGKALKNLLNF